MADSNTVDITDKKQGHKWKKGESGNPNGRPVGSVSIVEGIRKKLQEIEPLNQKTFLELFLAQLFHKAIKEGNEQLMRDMINRVDGMPKQTNDITSNGQTLKGLIQVNENDKSV